MGSSGSEWERALKLTGSAIELVTQGARSAGELADHFQQFAGPGHLVMLSDQYQRTTHLLFFALERATEDGQIEHWEDHLQAFVFGRQLTAPVNYDDLDHHQIVREQYVFVESGLTEADFPITRTGQADVTFAIIECRSWQEYFDKVKAAGNLCAPDIAETRDFHKAHPEERMKDWLGAPCGSVSRRHGRQGVACLSAVADGLHLRWHWLGGRWGQLERCLAVCK